MAIEITQGRLPTWSSEAEVYAARPWLQPGSLRRDGPHWIGRDETGMEGIIGFVAGAGSAAPQGGGTPGLAAFMLGYDYPLTETEGSSPVPASVFGGGLVGLPGLGVFGSGGKAGWLLWLLLAAGLVLVLSGRKAPRGRFAAR